MTRTDTASRVIAASVETVYAALVDPEALIVWLPPHGMPQSSNVSTSGREGVTEWC